MSDAPQAPPNWPRLWDRLDRPDYGVYSGEWDVGRIYETGGPDSLRWFWALTVNGPMTRSDRVATLEEAKVRFHESWEAWPGGTGIDAARGKGPGIGQETRASRVPGAKGA